jgi:hypothetical protein
MATQDSPSLYERLGGVYSIATVVDDFIDRIMIDPRLNANPRVDEAHHRVPPAGFKYLVNGNGLLRYWRPSKVHGPLHEGLAPRSHDHGNRVGRVSRRSSANP